MRFRTEILPGSGATMKEWATFFVVVVAVWSTVDAQTNRNSRSRSRGSRHRPARNEPVWTTWSHWTSCSTSCDEGTRSRYRGCVHRTSAGLKRLGSHNCHGKEKQYELCDSQPCPQGSDPRKYQCTQHNEEVIQNRTYDWIPFHTGSDPCQLNCLAAGFAFYNNFGTVTDGTPCIKHNAKVKDSNEDRSVCVNGKCEYVGCDGVVGSGARLDMCRICGGENANCFQYRNSFMPLDPPSEAHQQYQAIVRIPSGATYIEVTDHSSNYLALAVDRTYVLNGNWMIDWPKNFDVEDMTVKYKRTGRTEILTIEGPTTKNITVLLLFKTRNPGVHFEFYLPTSKIDQIIVADSKTDMKEYVPYIPASFHPPKYGSGHKFETSQPGRTTPKPINEDKPQHDEVASPKELPQKGLEIPLAKPLGMEIPLAKPLQPTGTTPKPTHVNPGGEDFGLLGDQESINKELADLLASPLQGTGAQNVRFVSPYKQDYRGTGTQAGNFGDAQHLRGVSQSGNLPGQTQGTGYLWSQWNNNYNYALYGPEPRLPTNSGSASVFGPSGHTDISGVTWAQAYRNSHVGQGAFSGGAPSASSARGNPNPAFGDRVVISNKEVSPNLPAGQGPALQTFPLPSYNQNVYKDRTLNAGSNVRIRHGSSNYLGTYTPSGKGQPGYNVLSTNQRPGQTYKTDARLHPPKGNQTPRLSPPRGQNTQGTFGINRGIPSVDSIQRSRVTENRLAPPTRTLPYNPQGQSVRNPNRPPTQRLVGHPSGVRPPQIPANVGDNSRTVNIPGNSKPNRQISQDRRPSGQKTNPFNRQHTYAREYIVSNQRKSYLEYYKDKEAGQRIQYETASKAPAYVANIQESKQSSVLASYIPYHELIKSNNRPQVRSKDISNIPSDRILTLPKSNKKPIIHFPVSDLEGLEEENVFDYIDHINNVHGKGNNHTKGNTQPLSQGTSKVTVAPPVTSRPRTLVQPERTVPRGNNSNTCPKCPRPKDLQAHFCKSEYVARMKITDTRIVGGETRYGMVLGTVFTGPVIPHAQYLWTDNRCRCPRLKKNVEYLVMGHVASGKYYISADDYTRVFKKNFIKKLPKLIKKCM